MFNDPTSIVPQNGNTSIFAGAVNNAAVNGRRTPADDELQKLIAHQMDVFVTAKRDFTAWDVTVELRAANPTVEIVHPTVRVLVHAAMQAIGSQFGYDVEWRDYNGNAAQTWFHIASQPVAIATPLTDTSVDGGAGSNQQILVVTTDQSGNVSVTQLALPMPYAPKRAYEAPDATAKIDWSTADALFGD